jgi:hypothetical protein
MIDLCEVVCHQKLCILEFPVMKNPNAVRDFIDNWIGFSKHYDGAPVAHQPVLTTIAAENLKQDAVVAAFKVSDHRVEGLPY